MSKKARDLKKQRRKDFGRLIGLLTPFWHVKIKPLPLKPFPYQEMALADLYNSIKENIKND